jgi:hypothetical protein
MGIAGCYCKLHEPLDTGNEVDLKVVLLGGGVSVQARGRVVRSEVTSSHVGVVVRFEDLPFDTERTIARWLDALALNTGLVRAVA